MQKIETQDPIAQLKADHRKVEKLFKEFESLKSATDKEKADLVQTILMELSAHATAEEEVFYIAYREKSQDLPLVLEAREEHHLVKILLSELAELSPSDEAYDAKVTVLKELIQHHVEEEEGEMFPEARKLFSKEEMVALAEKMELAKAKVKRQGVRITVTRLEEEIREEAVGGTSKKA